jgi:hypothetical protein
LVHPPKGDSPSNSSAQHTKLAVRISVGVVLFLVAGWLVSLLMRK